MSRRETDIVTAACPLTVRERLLLDDMKRLAGLASDANLVRSALFFFARHLDLAGLRVGDFGLRQAGRSGRVRRPGSKPKVAPTTRVEPQTGDLYAAGAQGLQP